MKILVSKSIILAFVFSFLLSVVSVPVFCGGPGTAAVPFLKIGIGAKPASMGEAYTAVGNGIYSLYFNPAIIAKMQDKEVAASQIMWIEGITYTHFGTAYYFKKIGTIGINYSILNYGDIPITTTDPTPVGMMTATDNLLMLSYARVLSPKISLGTNIKYITQNYYSYSSDGVLLDIGILTSIASFPLGISLQNVGNGFKMKNSTRKDTDPPPTELKIGTGYEFTSNRLRLAVDLAQVVDNKLNLGLGAEYGFLNNIIQVRGGYKYKLGGNDLGTISGLRFGFGINLYGTNVDYAFAPAGDLGVTHRMSLSYKFSQEILTEDKKSAITLESKEIGETAEEVVRVRKEVFYFAATDDVLSPEHSILVEKVLNIYKANPEFSIRIEGHNNIKETNKLSRVRAENVKKALIEKGIPNDVITIKWYGSSKPASMSITSEGLSNNSRVEVILWGKESIQ